MLHILYILYHIIYIMLHILYILYHIIRILDTFMCNKLFIIKISDLPIRWINQIILFSDILVILMQLN
jgi:hypothetical protein